MRLAIAASLLPALVGLDAFAQTTASVTVTFPAMVNYGTRPAPRVSGTVKPGAKVKIKYDRGRLMNTCYGTQGDRMRYRFDATSNFGVADLWSGYGNARQVDPVIEIPANAQRFEVYFERYGQNKGMNGAVPCLITADNAVKVFPVSATPPHVQALPNWTHPATRPVLRGQQVTIVYKRTMMSQCRQGVRIPNANVSFGYKMDDGSDRYVPLTRGQYAIQAPVNAYEFVFWFRGMEGNCPSWESDYSRNWRLPLYWPM